MYYKSQPSWDLLCCNNLAWEFSWFFHAKKNFFFNFIKLKFWKMFNGVVGWFKLSRLSLPYLPSFFPLIYRSLFLCSYWQRKKEVGGKHKRWKQKCMGWRQNQICYLVIPIVQCFKCLVSSYIFKCMYL